MYINEPIGRYLDDLAARKPAPGGGSAAALCGALGTALLEMVCNFTIGNEKYKDIESQVRIYLDSLKNMERSFAALIDEDIKAYSSIRKAFKTRDKKIIDKALKDGYYVSLKICELSRDAMRIALNLSEKSNINLITDVGCGAGLLRASFDSGIFNVEINLKGIGDRDFVSEENSVKELLKNEIEGLYKKTITKTRKRMR